MKHSKLPLQTITRPGKALAPHAVAGKAAEDVVRAVEVPEEGYSSISNENEEQAKLCNKEEWAVKPGVLYSRENGSYYS